MELSGAAPRAFGVRPAADLRGLLLAVYLSAGLWVGLGYGAQIIGHACR